MARNVVVTGGFGALGRVVADTFKAQGDTVARVDFAPSAPDGSGGDLDFAGVDLTDGEACQQLVAKIVDKLGGIDVLVNIAGGFTWETLGDGHMDSWRRMFTMNVMTAATITQAALEPIKASAAGRIINIGAGAAIKADTGMGAYAASKAGVHRLTEALAAELAGSSVTVNAVLPSIIDTPTNRADMPDADVSEWVKPQAIADAIAFLASSEARAISGALIPVTRGGEG
ncbi:3-oxoacyl-[acyl-carrier-protein] reductase [Croceicoccus estronivorus]|uniref:SDR family NAD(P)-dependent oxidoreductase n=1 Tax=Croceicoccus estronivorus TaxID=1172626 RepID=UPI000830C9A1|nr:SDR family NAD(P)-dependent oxidoreductase [Croceicoccus estronivorus]OCC22463.1 3-oxoacyl-[acyl-carrier-protein] reductase [Croceicoccus estronivorus]